MTTTVLQSVNVSTTTAPIKPTQTASGDVPATLTFYVPPLDGSKPYNYVEAPPEGVPSSNLREDVHTVTMHDLRGLESQFSLDKQAFQPVTNVPSAETEFVDEDRIKNIYYPEIESIITAHVPGVEQVVIFDHTIRRSVPGSNRRPVLRVHIDQSAAAGYGRVRRHLSAERAEEVISKGIRARIINVWRPLNGPILDHPLGYADSSTVDEEDVVGVRHIYPDREGETSGVIYNPEQKWWYWSGQKNDEVVLLKCWDSDTNIGGGAPGKRGRTPHTAFQHPGTPEGAKPRESIEIRCLVIG